MIVAAGDTHEDACMYSPGSAQRSFTVVASDISDNYWPQSNTGSCVDIAAPGVEVLAENDGRVPQLTGTGPASAMVAGVAALIRGQDLSLSTQAVYDRIQEVASVDVLNIPEGHDSSNVLVNTVGLLD